MESRLVRTSLLLLIVLSAVSLGAQQVQRLPLAPIPPKGEPVAPFFEGWFENPDGTFTFSFGYFNLNAEEILDIPLGPDNFIEPAEFDGDQPTHFPVEPRRDRGVFAVTVPASFGDRQQSVVWTITSNGVTYSVPARAGLDALQLDYRPKAMGSVPPPCQVRIRRSRGSTHSRRPGPASHGNGGNADKPDVVGVGGLGAVP